MKRSEGSSVALDSVMVKGDTFLGSDLKPFVPAAELIVAED